PSAKFCAAVDKAGGALTYDGRSWGPAAIIDQLASGLGVPLTSVSCPSAGFCAAVDEYGRALTYDGSSWGSPLAIEAPHWLTPVSCPVAGVCVAVDIHGQVFEYHASGGEPAPSGPTGAMHRVSRHARTRVGHARVRGAAVLVQISCIGPAGARCRVSVHLT